jgi:cytochrome c553
MPRSPRPLALARSVLLAFLAGSLSIGGTSAADPGGAGRGNGGVVAEQVRDLFSRRCRECHGPDAQEGGLRLDLDPRGAGEPGAVVVAGNRAASTLLDRVSATDPDRRMPPRGKPLSNEEIGLVGAWIDAGATWPEGAWRDPRLDHWAWQPVVRPDVPGGAVGAAAIDAFLVARLGESGLAPAPEADRRTLIRRASFDLVGLPPTPEEVAAFEADAAPDAFERLVDRLLASPAHGERWARHWLDVAHYADSHGYERDQLRPHAWRYRDWVIEALNADKPYDAFLREQVAGDVIAPEDPAAVVASAFLVAGPWDLVGQVETQSAALRRQARADDLDDMLTQVMAAACGVTINCARCHDHKLDPIPQRDYTALAALLAGVTRGDRPVSPAAVAARDARRRALEEGLRTATADVHALAGAPVDLADIVGGGDGSGNGVKGAGIDPRTGLARDRTPLSFLEGIEANRPLPGPSAFVAAVLVPDGSGPVRFVIDGDPIDGIPPTAREGWDAIRNGPVNAQASTTTAGIDYASVGHAILGLHANAAITFDLAAIRARHPATDRHFRAVVAYGGRAETAGAEVAVHVDGQRMVQFRLDQASSGEPLDIVLSDEARHLTLVATDGGDGIGHDQIWFGDPRIEGTPSRPIDAPALAAARARIETVRQELAALPETENVYGPVVQPPPPVQLLVRGDPEKPSGEILPGLPGWIDVPVAQPAADAGDGERRRALAAWITARANPLTPRVIVNRLWHHHFGIGLVDTPSDFGAGGGQPSHPALLDWLAAELVDHGWSLKHVHRLICSSKAFRQRSHGVPRAAAGMAIDSGNRLLWRMSPRRLDAESYRDAVLAVSGTLDPARGGPGFRDFRVTEAYAPIYETIPVDRSDLRRRSIYRCVVRGTPDVFLTTLDCPNPANLAPVRARTTTALQSLAILNNDFTLRHAEAWAERLRREAGERPADQVRLGFRLAFCREPDRDEAAAGETLVVQSGLLQFCRMMFAANEFFSID